MQELARDLQAVWQLVFRSGSNELFRVVEELELSLTQVKMLQLVDGADRPSVKELAEQIGISLPAASRAVDGLVRRGLVERHECAADRRSRRMAPTAGGRAAVKRLDEARLAGLTGFVETLEESERAALAQAVAPILERLRP